MRLGNNLSVAARQGGNPDFVFTWFGGIPGESRTLPLRSGFNYDFSVDWGDGSSDTITAYDDAARIHEYAIPDVYTVTISGTCEAWYFNHGGDGWAVYTVENWGDVGFTGEGLVKAFAGCWNATNFLGEGSLQNYTGITSLRETWADCEWGLSFPDVNALTLVTSLQDTWYGCTHAPSFPDVNALTSVTTMFRTWRSCSDMTSYPAVPALSEEEDSPLEDVSYAFYSCGDATGTGPEFWNWTDPPNYHMSCYRGNRDADNWAEMIAQGYA